MAKKKKKAKGITQVSITIELPDDEPAPNAADVFITKFFETLSYWILGALVFVLIGSCTSILL